MTTVAITGVTGNFGHGLIPLLEADPRVKRVIGIGRRPFDPADHGWTTVIYRRGDVRDPAVLTGAFAGADAVAHLAFAKFGHASRETLHAINIDGTLNAFAAAAAAGARRFAFASSIAAYGFHADNPTPIPEDWPARGSSRWFYSREKAQVEARLREAATAHPDLALTIFRPTVVVGPQTAATIGEIFPPALRRLIRAARRPLAALGVPTPTITLPHPLQLVHEEDVGQALALALLGGRAGTYNLAADGSVDGHELARELGLTPLPIPAVAVRTTARALLRVPRRPPALEAVEVLTQPVIVDAAAAKQQLGWHPRYTALEALRATVRG